MSKLPRVKRGSGYIHTFGWTGDAKLDLDYFHNRLIPIIRTYFVKAKPHIYFRKGERTVDLKVYSIDFFNWFESLGFNPGIKTYTVQILRVFSHPDLLSFVIRGIYDTDGCVHLDTRAMYARPYPGVILKMANERLISQVRKYLELYVSVYSQELHCFGRATSYTVEFYGAHNLAVFLEKVGFSNPRHLKKIVQLKSFINRD
jgi:hypothetical protein